ncbi:MAG: glutathione S-transferase family protein [Pseudomonadales bacterium]
MMTNELILYYSSGACSMASHIGLKESGLPFEARPVNLFKGDQRAESFLALNPKGRIPLLLTSAGPISESPAILEYVASMAPEAGLVPKDPYRAAKMRAFNSYLCATVHVAHAHGPRGQRWADSESALAELKAKVPSTMLAAFRLIEDELANGSGAPADERGRSSRSGPWVLGDAYSVCDAYLYTFARWLELDGVDTSELPFVMAHRRLMETRPAVQTVIKVEGVAPMSDAS